MNRQREPKVAPAISASDVAVGPFDLPGISHVPDNARAIVIFAHGSGSSRLSPRNNYVANAFNRVGFATLLFDLLTPAEEADRDNVFDIPLLADRLNSAVAWTKDRSRLRSLPVGLFGASTGAAAALVTAAWFGNAIGAVVSRGGRPDLAAAALDEVSAPTLLIVGGRDPEVLTLNEQALARLPVEKSLKVIPGATHLFEEPGALDQVVEEATTWFRRHLVGDKAMHH
jgi:pimeloyl-ACP methyl ester carboxylesterase